MNKFLFILLLTFCASVHAQRIPSYISLVASDQQEPLTILALVNTGRMDNGQWKPWPWTVFVSGKPVFLKNQYQLVRYLSADPKTPFGLYGLTMDDFRADGINDIYVATLPINHVRLARKHVQYINPDWLAQAGEHYGINYHAPKTYQPSVKPLDQDIEKLIAYNAKKYGVDAHLIRAVIRAESAYKVGAVSHKGAVGLMQVMPATARGMGVNPDELTIPSVAIDAGTRYLAEQLKTFRDVKLALAAYNAGPGAVRRYNYAIPPFKETQNYVRKVLRFKREYEGGRRG